MKKFRDTKRLSREEQARIDKLADELQSISPFDIGAREVEPFWFAHPQYETVFCKIGPVKKGTRVAIMWVTITTLHDAAIFLTLRMATSREAEYFRGKISNA